MSGEPDVPILALAAADFEAIAAYRCAVPTSTLALLFTDLVPDPALTRPPEGHEALAAMLLQKLRADHVRLVRDVTERDDEGCCVAEFGDSTLCVFRSAAVAAARALQLQREIERRYASLSAPEQVRVRAGLDAGDVGEAVLPHARSVGRLAFRAGELADAAAPGQLLLSSAARAAAAGALPCADLHPVAWRERHDLARPGGEPAWEVANEPTQPLPSPAPTAGELAPPSPAPAAAAPPRDRRVPAAAGSGPRRKHQLPAGRPWLAGGAALLAAAALYAGLAWTGGGRPGEGGSTERVLGARAQELPRAPRQDPDQFIPMDPEGLADVLRLLEADPSRFNPARSPARIALTGTLDAATATLGWGAAGEVQQRVFHLDAGGQPAMLRAPPAGLLRSHRSSLRWECPPPGSQERVLILTCTGPLTGAGGLLGPPSGDEGSPELPYFALLAQAMRMAASTPRPAFALALATLSRDPQGAPVLTLAGPAAARASSEQPSTDTPSIAKPGPPRPPKNR